MNAPVAPRRRRWKRLILLGSMALVVIGVFATYRVLTEPARVRRMAERLLNRVCTTGATLGSASFSLWGGLKLADLVVPAPGDYPNAPPVLTCGSVSLDVDFSSLLSGEVRVDAVAAEDLSAFIVFDPATGRFDIQDAFDLTRRKRREPLEQLPAISVNELKVRLCYRTPERLVSVDSLRLGIAGRQVEDEVYRLTWMSRQARRDASGAFEHDFGAQEIREVAGGSPWFTIDTIEMILSAAAPKIHEALLPYDLRGRVRTQGWAFRYGGQPTLVALNLELEELAASIPLDDAERPLPGEERYVRFAEGVGKIQIAEQRAALALDARFHGSPLHLEAAAEGVLPPAGSLDGLDIHVRGDLRHWEFPKRGPGAPEAEARFVNRWQRLRYFYNDFDPHGPADLNFHVRHAGGAGWHLARAELRPRGLDAMHRSFPYRVGELTGLVVADPDGIHIRELWGRHDGATVFVEGWLGGAGPREPAEVHLQGRTVALDEELCDALPTKYATAWRRLQPAGYTDVFVRLSRAPDEDARWTTEVSAELRGTDILYDDFPYPVRDLAGPILVDGDTLRIDGLRGRAGDGPITVSGSVSVGGGGLTGLDLRLAAGAVPLDDRLRRALMPAAREQLDAFAAAGATGIDAHLTWNAQAQDIEYDVALDLEQVDVKHASLPIPVANLIGHVRLQPSAVQLERVSGSVGGGRVELDGHIENLAEQPSGNVEVRVAGVHLDDAIRAGLPPAAREALADWRVEGPIDLEGRWSRAPQSAGDGHLRAHLPLSGLRVMYAGFPIPIEVTSGAVTVDGSKLDLQGVRGSAEGARVAVGGSVAWGDEVRVNLEFDAAEVRFTPALRDASPWRVRRLWNDVEPAGSMTIRGGRIGYFRPAGGGPPEWTVAGELAFKDAAFDLGPQLTDLTGSASLTGQGRGRLSDIGLRGTLTAAEMTVGAWPLAALQGSFSREAQTGRWVFPDIRGRLFGGSLQARLDVTPQGQESAYELTATVEQARMNDLAAAWRTDAGVQQDVAGLLSGRVYLTGRTADEAGRQGGGRVQLRDAKLYKFPLLLSVINVVNFARPEEAVFREGTAEFYLVGPTLEVRSLVLKGPALALSGDGTMNLNNKQLDLRLIVTNPHEWARVPVVTEIVEGAVRELFEVQVSGTPSNPRATAKPLHRVEGAVETLLAPLLPGRQ